MPTCLVPQTVDVSAHRLHAQCGRREEEKGTRSARAGLLLSAPRCRDEAGVSDMPFARASALEVERSCDHSRVSECVRVGFCGHVSSGCAGVWSFLGCE
eukprot:2436148-Rhodomonas_salina.2